MINTLIFSVRLKEFVAQAKEEVPRLVGMKYSSGDMLELTRFCATQESKSFKIFTGNEQVNETVKIIIID